MWQKFRRGGGGGCIFPDSSTQDIRLFHAVGGSVCFNDLVEEQLSPSNVHLFFSLTSTQKPLGEGHDFPKRQEWSMVEVKRVTTRRGIKVWHLVVKGVISATLHHQKCMWTSLSSWWILLVDPGTLCQDFFGFVFIFQQTISPFLEHYTVYIPAQLEPSKPRTMKANRTLWNFCLHNAKRETCIKGIIKK